MKFGGTSVATVERIRNVARHVKREVEAGYQVAVVVSAMAGKTNELVGWCKEASALYSSKEYDTVVASGEQVTSGLLAIVLQDLGHSGPLLAGLADPDPHLGRPRLGPHRRHRRHQPRQRLQGRRGGGDLGLPGHPPGTGRITTLGRGGSDTSAVAIAAAIQAERCDIYTDVDGVYTTDPRIVKQARRLDRVSFEEMLEMASLGAKVLQVRSVELAMLHQVPTYVRSSFDDPADPKLGTLICDEDQIMEQQIVTGIAYSRDEAQITLRNVADKPGIAASIFVPLADANINVDMIIQVVSDDAQTTDITFTVPAADYERACAVLHDHKDEIHFQALQGATDVVKVSAIGVGMRSHAGVAAKAFKALAERGINIRAITTSEIKFSVLIDQAYTELGGQDAALPLRARQGLKSRSGPCSRGAPKA
jgi:aspartate kinase